MPARNDVRRISTGGRDSIALVALLVGGYVAWTTRWVSFVALGAFVLWTFLDRRKGLWSKASAPFVLSAGLGVGVLTLFVFVLDVGGWFISPDALMRLEYRLIATRLALKQATSFSTATLLLIVTALLVLNVKAPRSHAVRLWFAVTGKVSKVVVALTAILSFSFFSALPADGIEQAVFDHMVHDGLISVGRYTVSIRMEWDAVAKYLTAEYASQEVARFTPEQVILFRNLFESIQKQTSVVIAVRQCDRQSRSDHVCWGPYRDDPSRLPRDYGAVRTDPEVKRTVSVSGDDQLKVLDSFIEKQLFAAHIDAAHRASMPERTDPSIGRFEAATESKPTALENWRHLKSALDGLEVPVAEQERQAEQAKERAEAAELGVRKLLIATISPELPGIEGIAGAYISKLFDALAEWTLERAVQKATALGKPVSKPEDAMSVSREVPFGEISDVQLFSDIGQIMPAQRGSENRDAVEAFVASETAKAVYDRAAPEISLEASNRGPSPSGDMASRRREDAKNREKSKPEFRFRP